MRDFRCDYSQRINRKASYLNLPSHRAIAGIIKPRLFDKYTVPLSHLHRSVVTLTPLRCHTYTASLSHWHRSIVTLPLLCCHICTALLSHLHRSVVTLPLLCCHICTALLSHLHRSVVTLAPLRCHIYIAPLSHSHRSVVTLVPRHCYMRQPNVMPYWSSSRMTFWHNILILICLTFNNIALHYYSSYYNIFVCITSLL